MLTLEENKILAEIERRKRKVVEEEQERLKSATASRPLIFSDLFQFSRKLTKPRPAFKKRKALLQKWIEARISEESKQKALANESQVQKKPVITFHFDVARRPIPSELIRQYHKYTLNFLR